MTEQTIAAINRATLGTADAQLAWGIRGSFLAYVDALPDGVIRAENGATRSGQVFQLPGRRIDEDGFAFEGRLRFFGYGGVLDVALEHFRARLTGHGGEITTVVSGVRIPIASLRGASDEGPVRRFDTVTLTDDGAAILGGVYSPGASADPVTIRTAP